VGVAQRVAAVVVAEVGGGGRLACVWCGRVIAATDDREVQRIVGRRALALDIPAIFPGLYEHDGGEVFVQRSPRSPCFFCRDGFRPTNETLRGVTATNPDILGIITLASRLSLGVLDPSADYLRRLMTPSAGETAAPQLFVDNGLGLARLSVPWRKDCPSCAVGPSPMRKEAVEAWRTAESRRKATTTDDLFAPPPSSSPGQADESTSAPSLWGLAFLAAPIIIMAVAVPAKNAHTSGFIDVVMVICFFWFLGGIAALFIDLD
jgi:hypothetical protein